VSTTPEERVVSVIPQSLIDKIKALPAERIGEVEDFVDFIAARAAAAQVSAPAFAKVWNNPDDDAYNAL
jgi:hypothetical protein